MVISQLAERYRIMRLRAATSDPSSALRQEVVSRGSSTSWAQSHCI
jgi:hypothetical protein